MLRTGPRPRARSLEGGVQLPRDAAARGLEEEGEEAVQEGRHASERHPRTVAAGEEAVFEVGLPDLVRVRGERVAHDASGYFAAIQLITTSSMRLEKPHSLSYQLETFTSRPETLVSVASKVEEAGSWLKSTETSGALL